MATERKRERSWKPTKSTHVVRFFVFSTYERSKPSEITNANMPT